MQTAHEFFLHELSDMLDAERRILYGLEQQSKEGANEKLQQAFQQHHEQTQGQIVRLEQCFEELGEEPEDTECAGIKGILEEHDNIKEEDPSDDILDVFNATAATKVERYEITAYEALINLADLMEHTKVSKLLKQNLREEEQTLKKITAISGKLEIEDMGMEEEEEDEGEEVEELGEEDDSIVAGVEERDIDDDRRGKKAPTKSKSRGRRIA